MADDLKIAMLGTTASGKTCYMLGMYATMQMGMANFTLRALDLNQDVMLNNRWDALLDETKGKDRWPPPNVGVTESYVFELCYGFKPKKQFQWLDYRGRALIEEPSAKDVQELQQHLLSADGLFLCFSGENLTKKLTEKILSDGKETIHLTPEGRRIARGAGVNSMNWYLTELQKTKKTISTNTPFPVSIAITKYDLCHRRGKDELIDDIKGVFRPLFAEDTGWFVAICPITLGKDLAQDINHASINPKNLETPLMFAIHTHYRNILIAKLSYIQSQQGRSVRFKERNVFYRVFNNDELDAIRRDLGLAEGQAKELQYNMQLVARALKQIPIYLNGEEETIDV